MSHHDRAQRELDRWVEGNLHVDETDYFGARRDRIFNAHTFGLKPAPERDLYRVSYLYLMAYGNAYSEHDYGGIQIRAHTYLYLRDGSVPVQLQEVIQRIAHRAAMLFDSDVEEPYYGSGGRGWSDPTYDGREEPKKAYKGPGGGYLTGFTAAEVAGEYDNWEVAPVGRSEADQIGRIDWSVEIYLELEGTNIADLSGVARGVGDPWSMRVVPPEPGIDVEHEIWRIHDTLNEARGSMQINPPPRTVARKRREILHEKDVYVNGLFIGQIDRYGRVWLKLEYQRGDTYRGRHSREGLLNNSEAATPQALRLGGVLYKYDESPSSVHLATARAVPPGFDPLDPDEVDPHRDPRGETAERYVLALQDPEESTRIMCREDREIIRHLGKSNPPYEHEIASMFNWPDFRPIEEYGRIDRGGPDLGDFGGDDE